MELNKIYLTDAYEGMQKLDDNSVDLVLTDPPYGIGYCSEGKGKISMGKAQEAQLNQYSNFDDSERPNKKSFDKILEVSNKQIVFGGQHFTDFLPQNSRWLIWDKKPSGCNGQFAGLELAWTSLDGSLKRYTWKWQGMLQENMKEKEQRYHPTQKPVGLFKAILNDYSEEGDLILDPFIGSGTTGIAARALDRDFIGFEKNEEYVNIARKRLGNVQKELIR